MSLKIPNHIAIIMDGNGRWAKQKGLFRTEGHKKGSERVKEVVREAQKQGVKILTLFAFSTENWDRPEQEKKYLFAYLREFLDGYKQDLIEEGIRFKAFGRRDRIEDKTMDKVKEIEKVTSSNNDFFLNIALDYGGKWDIVNAAGKIVDLVWGGSLKKEQLDEKVFRNYLSLSDFDEPDILVRTAGEKRISNFLLWQSAYAEFYFPEVLWPDFDKKWVGRVIEEYSKRKRTFGKVDV